MAVDLRPADVADAPAIAALHVAGWQAGYRDLLPASYLQSLSVEERTRGWATGLAEGTQVLLAELQGRPAGFVCYGPSWDADLPVGSGEVYALYVAPQDWGSGVGGDCPRFG